VPVEGLKVDEGSVARALARHQEAGGEPWGHWTVETLLKVVAGGNDALLGVERIRWVKVGKVKMTPQRMEAVMRLEAGVVLSQVRVVL